MCQLYRAVPFNKGTMSKAQVSLLLSARRKMERMSMETGNTKGGSITVPLTSYLTGFESVV